MRVGLVSPYSYTYPGGVGRHVEALAEELLGQGHDVRLLAPYDPDDRIARTSHRGARPERRPLPDYFIPLGRTVGLPLNGAISNISVSPAAVGALGKELRHGGYDMVHVHEPNGVLVSWFATETCQVPMVGTFHTYSTNRLLHPFAANVAGVRRLYSKLSGRIAVSEAARWTAQRYYGGDYRVIPNGVDLTAARPAHDHSGEELRLLFVGRAEERKGLPVLLRAFEALRGAGVAARLTIAGATADEVEPMLLDAEGVEIEGRVSEERKWELLGSADLLVAPSLGGESFGMVLTEAFASATPVVCSDIAGYRDVVRDGTDGVLVPTGDPAELGETLRALALDPARRARMSESAREGAERFAWPRVTREVVDVYEDALAAPAPEGRRERAAAAIGARPADGRPRVGPKRLPSLEPALVRRKGAFRTARRVAVAAGALAGVGLTALALHRLGVHEVGKSLIAATEVWVLVGFALMCASMLLRAEAWHAILRAALPGTRVRRRDAARGTMIGVLMSATLPARLGEPSRAYIVARRLGRVRDRFPIVLGTIVSQTILNLVALVILGSVMLASVGLFRGGVDNLVIATVAPVVVILLLLTLPALMRGGRPSRFQRVQQAVLAARRMMFDVRRGLDVFRSPRLGGWAAVNQLAAWALQWLACYVLLVALGLDDRAGMGAAAAVLFAVNLTSAIPATPSNVGVFQAACIAVLSAYGVNKTDAFAYGIILQAVEISTAVAMGMPALLREGMTWKDLRLRALHSAPVELTRRAEV